MTALDAEELRGRVESDFSRVVDLLNQKIALKSVSAEGITGEHMKRSAQFVAEQLAQEGVDARVVQSRNPDGTDGAYEVIGSKIVDPAAPTVLLYAHHDVQPVPDASAWSTDPFVGTEIDGRLFGRGAADDGGGIAIHSGALRALGDDLGVNVKVFVEGEEEMGSPSFIPFIEAHRDEFDADVIIVADSGNWSAEVPSLTTSLRGNTDLDVTLKVLEHPVHSGQFGGPILDANTLSAMLIGSMYDKDGELAIEGLASQEPVGGLQRDIDEQGFRADGGVVESYRLAGRDSLASRLWVKPSIAVIGFDAHPVEGSFNVIADTARFRLSIRTAPSQRPEDAAKAVTDFLIAHAPFGAEVRVETLDQGMGWSMDPDAEASKDAMTAMREAFGVEPVNKGEGGSIPFIPELQRIFPDAQVLVTGPEDPKANAHSPNESIDLKSLKNNILTEALILSKLGE
ncbi:Acetylornithine deacetylase/Succinyl-diaminopimelate desuccinylase [Bifidobacterium bohemicum]|uniref:Peptidase family M20/M25/M40 n=1 Tax=Bifidobacterium bohemicum DSM 22767 TaxID=1437606 RepID=A0A086ZJI1_9BIFI|nr:dipeptidase [Bifidobacterium bohemicum]KFI46681.1 peptidase family M20/M25/M40 [Bifidobacterium bohemicum DSM 22767]SCB78650.1 Acetylornithine deacetylase/Succinyl-diaminopimelate desuccinylase [Bifidobacterium bohemicum]